MSNEKILPDYQAASDLLSHAKLPLSPAECHGLLMGFLSASTTMAKEASLESVFGSLQTSDETARKFILSLFSISSQQLGSLSFDVQLFLPDDEVSLKLRTESLSQWCQGFMTGLGLAGVQSQDLQQGEAQEALTDIAEIAKLDTQEVDDNEEDERAFMEICEYVRMGVLIIYTELCKPDDDGHQAQENTTLH